MIWHRRNVLNEPAPWSDDEILMTYKFCNVYRELDKCSQHLIDWVIDSNELNLEDKIFNILLYRRFNTPDFFSVYGPQRIKSFSPDKLINKMDEQKEMGFNLFNSAYIICQVSFESAYRKSDKHVQQILLISNLRKRIEEFHFHVLPDGGNYIEALHELLMEEIPLTGGFLAYQYCSDISYLPELQGKFEDLNAFCNVGPGAKGGVDLIYPYGGGTYEGFCSTIWGLQELHMPKEWNNIYYKDAYYKSKWLSLSNIQNCLCEYRKYHNLQTNPKCRKRYYKQGA